MAKSSEAVCIYIAKVQLRSAATPAGTETRYCFIPAPDHVVAGQRLQDNLTEIDFELVNTEFLRSYWDYVWSTKAEQKRYDEFAQQAYQTRELLLAPLEKE